MANDIIFAPLKAVHFSQDIFRPGFHFKIGVRKIAVLIVTDADFILNGPQHLQHSCQFMLGKQVGMQTQVSKTLGFPGKEVLADEHKCGKEDGFQGHDHRQETIGIRVKRSDPQMAGIE